MVDFVDALSRIQQAYDSIDVAAAWTEADTRAVLIDPLLDAFGWRPEMIRREPYDSWNDTRGYLDFLLFLRGKPFMVVEAKKTARTFNVPAALAKKGHTTLKKLLKTGSDDLSEAIDQCCRYSVHCGAVYACATNGLDYVFFKPYHAGRLQNDARVVVFNGLDAALKRLDEFSALISAAELESGSAEFYLTGAEAQIPTFAKKLDDEVPYRGYTDYEAEEYNRVLDGVIRDHLLELVDEQTFQRCYVRVPWTRSTNDALDALLRNQIALFQDACQESAPELVLPRRNGDLQSAGRTILLHGPIGIGKTSYLRQLRPSFLQRNAELKPGAIWASIDLLDFHDEPFSTESTQRMAARISEELRSRVACCAQDLQFNLDPEEWRHLRDIYNIEARRFQKERYPESDDTDEEYLRELRKYIWELKNNDPQQHLIRTVFWLTTKQRVPTVIVLDNSDQLGLEFQEFLYQLSIGIRRKTSAVTILCLRTEALLSHRIKRHSLANVEESYEVQRASLIDIMVRRCAEMELQLRSTSSRTENPNLHVALDRLGVLISTLKTCFEQNLEPARLIRTAGNGNLRTTFEAVARVFRLDSKEMDNMVVAEHKYGSAKLKTYLVLRAVLRERSGRYQSSSPGCLIPNVFPVDLARRQPPSLVLRLLLHIRGKCTPESAPTLSSVTSDFACAGADPKLVRRVLSHMRLKNLLAVPHMLPDISDDDTLRITILGEGMLDVINTTSYLDAVLWDTVIYDRGVFQNLQKLWSRGPRTRDTYRQLRATFRTYLLSEDSSFRHQLVDQFIEPDARPELGDLVTEWAVGH